MRGRKPNLKLVTPLTDGEGPTPEQEREVAIQRVIDDLRPRGLDPQLRKEWERVARILADPVVDRLKPRFVDVILEYCRATVRLRRLRGYFDEMAERLAKEAAAEDAAAAKPHPLDAEIHMTEGRHGEQLKSHPLVAQMNETWRQWRSMVQMLGLSPADERNMLPGQGDLFDDADKYLA
jgi:P27 family predicted phage terminase small subunit